MLVSVADYGAVGDGVTDDQPAFAAAFAALLSAGGGTLSVPPLVYHLHSMDTRNAVLDLRHAFSSSSAKTVSVQGAGAILTTDQHIDAVGDTALVAMIRAYGGVNLQVRGVAFRNTHGPTNGDTVAVYCVGGASNVQRQVQFQDCSFSGFSRGLLMQGVVAPRILNCSFLSPNGHDSGTTNTRPNVGLWFLSNASGQCVDVLVQGNVFDGYSGANGLPVDAPSTVSALDGGIYGSVASGKIAGNTFRNFCAEGIFLAHYAPSTGTVEISNNIVLAEIVDGSQNFPAGSKSPRVFNYGIRCDAKRQRVQGNKISGATHGIFCYTGNNATAIMESVDLSGNLIHLSAKRPPLEAIATISSPAMPATSVCIEDSVIAGGGQEMIVTMNCPTVVARRNTQVSREDAWWYEQP